MTKFFSVRFCWKSFPTRCAFLDPLDPRRPEMSSMRPVTFVASVCAIEVGRRFVCFFLVEYLWIFCEEVAFLEISKAWPIKLFYGVEFVFPLFVLFWLYIFFKEKRERERDRQKSFIFRF